MFVSIFSSLLFLSSLASLFSAALLLCFFFFFFVASPPYTNYLLYLLFHPFVFGFLFYPLFCYLFSCAAGLLSGCFYGPPSFPISILLFVCFLYALSCCFSSFLLFYFALFIYLIPPPISFSVLFGQRADRRSRGDSGCVRSDSTPSQVATLILTSRRSRRATACCVSVLRQHAASGKDG